MLWQCVVMDVLSPTCSGSGGSGPSVPPERPPLALSSPKQKHVVSSSTRSDAAAKQCSRQASLNKSNASVFFFLSCYLLSYCLSEVGWRARALESAEMSSAVVRNFQLLWQVARDEHAYVLCSVSVSTRKKPLWK